MRRLDRQEFVEKRAEYDQMVLRCEGVDPFCSSSSWILAADEALQPGREPFIFAGDSAFIAAAIRENEQGLRVVEALEAMWGLAAPVVGLQPTGTAQHLIETLRDVSGEWDGILLTGLLDGHELLREVALSLATFCEIRMGQATPRYIVDLSDGVDAFLAGKSRNFRRSLSRARRRAVEKGLRFESAHSTSRRQADEVYARIQAIELRSWKGQCGVGIDGGHMGAFYRAMGPDLAASEQHRCIFARLGEEDVGYILGGVIGHTYRGLQFSYDDEHSGLSIGNLMQLEQMEELARAGITRYDLGSEAHYKARWADKNATSPVLFAMKR